MLTNNDRAIRAAETIAGYSGDNDLETDLRDMLCDLRHVADALGLDIAQTLVTTEVLYNEEVDEDGGKATVNL